MWVYGIEVTLFNLRCLCNLLYIVTVVVGSTTQLFPSNIPRVNHMELSVYIMAHYRSHSQPVLSFSLRLSKRRFSRDGAIVKHVVDQCRLLLP